MATFTTVKKAFNDIKVGTSFIYNGSSCLKTSALTYLDNQNIILGDYYSTPGMVVEVTEVVNPAPAKKSSKKR